MKKNDHAAMKYQILLMLQQEGPLTPTEITERLAGIIGMDDDEFDERYEGRPNDKVFYKSVATNEQHLKAAGLLDFLGKPGHCITFEGIQALMDNEASRQIEYSYLRQFPAYCQWSEKFRKPTNLSEDIFSSLPTTNEQSTRRGKTDACIEAGTFIETDIDHIDWPEGITHIGHDAFAHCGNLETVIIPDTVTQVGERAFIECLSLRAISFSKGMSEIPLGCCAECLVLETVNIPSNIRHIGYDAFAKCLRLQRVTIPEGVISIGEGAFSYCDKLATIFLPASVKEIGEDVFYSCDALQEIIVPKGCKEKFVEMLPNWREQIKEEE